jgi:signal transduction histidine kinase/CheY-like chemotaxis protein
MHVLVIEDNLVDFRLIERALGGDAVLSQVVSLSEGIRLARIGTYDLVILDLTVEDSSGYETFQKARDAINTIPIVVLSGIDDDKLALRAVAEGAQDYVCKSKLLDYPMDRIARYAIERHRTEQKIRESERLARATVDSLSSNIAILDESGTIQAVNAAWNRFATENGMPPAYNWLGTNYLSACDPASGDGDEMGRAAATGIRSVIEGKQRRFEIEYPCHSPTEERWFLMRATPFEGEGPTRIVIDHENVTARIVAERLSKEQCGLREAVAGMEQVLGVVGHELRTPLAAVRAISEFLTTDGAKDTAQANDFLRTISDEVDRMSDTVNNLLEAARLNSGRARWNWSEIDPGELVADAASAIRPLVDASRVRLDAAVSGTPTPILGDGEAIGRLLINLLSNATKHTKDGQITVRTRQFTDAGGGWIDFVVCDTGCGISPDVCNRLGEAFALNSGVVGKNHVNGTGLGLAICKGIALAHGGRIMIESASGRGTTITARLRTDLAAATSGDTDYSQSTDDSLSHAELAR